MSAKRHKGTRQESDERFDETPRILSSEEKRGLILAHAATRKTKDPLQRVTLWTGVLVALIAVTGGWFMTVGYKVSSDISGSGDELQRLKEELDAFTERAKTNPVVNPPKLPGPTTEAAAAQFEGVLRDILNDDDGATTTRRNDLLAPSLPSASGTSAETSKTEEALPPVNPDAPGLIPDYRL